MQGQHNETALADLIRDLRFRAAAAESRGEGKGDAIRSAFIEALESGALRTVYRLPDIVTLANTFDVGTSTMQRVLKQLCADHVLRRTSRGHVVAYDPLEFVNTAAERFVQRMIASDVEPEFIEEAVVAACAKAREIRDGRAQA